MYTREGCLDSIPLIFYHAVKSSNDLKVHHVYRPYQAPNAEHTTFKGVVWISVECMQAMNECQSMKICFLSNIVFLLQVNLLRKLLFCYKCCFTSSRLLLLNKSSFVFSTIHTNAPINIGVCLLLHGRSCNDFGWGWSSAKVFT